MMSRIAPRVAPHQLGLGLRRDTGSACRAACPCVELKATLACAIVGFRPCSANSFWQNARAKNPAVVLPALEVDDERARERGLGEDHVPSFLRSSSSVSLESWCTAVILTVRRAASQYRDGNPALGYQAQGPQPQLSVRCEHVDRRPTRKTRCWRLSGHQDGHQPVAVDRVALGESRGFVGDPEQPFEADALHPLRAPAGGDRR